MDLGKKSILRPKTTTKRLYPIGIILARIKIPYIALGAILLSKLSLKVRTQLHIGTQCVGFQFLLILDLWGMSFHAMIVFGLGT